MASRHTGAELMYYGGTVIEVALAAVVMTHWYLVSGRALARTRRRSQSAGPQLPIALQPAPRLGSAAAQPSRPNQPRCASRSQADTEGATAHVESTHGPVQANPEKLRPASHSRTGPGAFPSPSPRDSCWQRRSPGHVGMTIRQSGAAGI
jgi:hypothetical protein